VHHLNKPSRLTVLVFASIVIAVTNAVSAKVVRTTLEELVEKSELVLYGVTTRHEGGQPAAADGSIVWFKADVLLKAPQGLANGDVAICEESSQRDTIDLRTYPGAYVVFASERGDCFSPVAGYKSLIPVSEGIAQTVSIDEQPKAERLDVFLAKVRNLIQGTK